MTATAPKPRDLHAAIRDLQTQIGADDVERRRALVAQLEKLSPEQLERSPTMRALQDTEAAALARWQRVSEPVVQAQRDYVAAQFARRQALADWERRRSVIEKDLRESAPGDLFDLRLQLTNYDDGRQWSSLDLSHAQLMELLKLLRWAVQRCDQLALEVCDSAQFAAEVKKIEDAIRAAGGTFEFRPDRRAAL
jgi:hypothetical protein